MKKRKGKLLNTSPGQTLAARLDGPPMTDEQAVAQARRLMKSAALDVGLSSAEVRISFTEFPERKAELNMATGILGDDLPKYPTPEPW
jgi:cysteine synthase